MLISLAAVLVGLWLLNDANRQARHLDVAERMMRQGVPQAEAMERSGSNFWAKPWHKRLLKSYPSVPTV